MIEEYDIIEAVVTITVFVAIGISANVSRYREKIENNPEAWQAKKAAPVVLVGAGAGVLAFALGLPPEVTAISGVLGGLVPIADELRSGKVSFLETYRTARGRGLSSVESAAAGASDASNDVDVERIRGGVEDIEKTVEVTEGGPPDDADDPDDPDDVGSLERLGSNETVTEGG